MSGVNSVGSSVAADLVKILEANQQATMELAEKMIKVAAQGQVSESEATGLGQMVDLLA